MEKLDKSLVHETHYRFYKAYIKREQFKTIPSMEGIKLELDLMKRPNADYICFYAIPKLINAKLNFDEAGDFYYTSDIDLEPDFYISMQELEGLEGI